MRTSLTHFIVRHRYPALAFTFLVSFIPMLGAVGILLAGLMTLIKGPREGAIFTAAASVPYLFLYSPTDPHVNEIMIWIIVNVGSNVVTWFFAAMLYRKPDLSEPLQVATLLGVFAISILHLVYPHIADEWSTEFLALYKQQPAYLSTLFNISAAQLSPIISLAKYIANGFIVAFILLLALTQVIFCKWWQSFAFKTEGVRQIWYHIRLSPLAGTLFMASVVFAIYGNQVIIDIMPTLYFMFLVSGLSLIHYLFSRIPNKTMSWTGIGVFYLLLLVVRPISPIIVFGVILLALIDIWFNFRKRFTTVQ